MTPHAYYSSGGTLAETYLARTGWTSRRLAGQPGAGSAIVADTRASGPEVFFFSAGGQLTSSADVNGTWSVFHPGGPATTRPGSLALGDTASGPELFYLSGRGLVATARTGRGWATAPVVSPSGVAPDSPLAAVSTGAHQVDVFFTDGHGRLAEAAQGRPSTAAGRARLGTAVYYVTRSGQPAVTYAAAGQPWHRAALPGTATRILGADAYQVAGEPSRVFLSGPARSGQLNVAEAPGPGGPWVARSPALSSSRSPAAAVWLAAFGLAAVSLTALGLIALRMARRRRARRPHAPGP